MADEPAAPPPSSNLTDEQKRKAEHWFQTRAANKAVCPVCSSRTWTLLPDMIAPPTFHGGSLVLGGRSYPHIVMVCTTCGNSQFINAIVAGVLEVKS